MTEREWEDTIYLYDPRVNLAEGSFDAWRSHGTNRIELDDVIGDATSITVTDDELRKIAERINGIIAFIDAK